MKNLVLTIFAVSFLVSCKKSSDGNKSVIVEESVETTVNNSNGEIDSSTTKKVTKEIDGQKTTEETKTYKASNGSRANVTIINSPKENTMLIKANGTKYQLDKKSETLYERNGVSAKLKGDSLFINQDNMVIELVLDK